MTAGAAPPPAAERLDGLTVPGLANAHSHAFQRALRGRAQERGEGSFWTWRERMYELADGSTPTATSPWHGPLRRDGAGRDHRGRRVPLSPPSARWRSLRGSERARRRGDRGRSRGGPADHPARHLLPARRLRRSLPGPSSSASAIATPPHGPSASTRSPRRPEVRVGAAIHSVRAVDPESAAPRRRLGGRARATAARAPLRATRRERGGLRAHGLTPTAILAGAGALETRFTAVHATHLSDEDVAHARRRRRLLLPLPDHRTRPRRRDRRRPPAARRRRSLALGSDSQAFIDPFEEARAVELDQRLASGRRGLHSAAELLGAACAGRPCEHRLGRRRPDRGGDARRPRHDRARRRRGWPGPPPPPRSSRSSSRRPPPTSAGCSPPAARSSATAPTSRSTPARELAAAIAALEAPMSSLAIDRIGLLVTNDPELGEGPLGIVRDAALVVADGRVAAVERSGRGRRRAARRRRALPDPRLRRQPHPPDLRRRSQRASSRRGWPAVPTRRAGSA